MDSLQTYLHILTAKNKFVEKKTNGYVCLSRFLCECLKAENQYGRLCCKTPDDGPEIIDYEGRIVEKLCLLELELATDTQNVTIMCK